MPSTIIIIHPHRLQFAMAFSASLFYPSPNLSSTKMPPYPLLFRRPRSVSLPVRCSSAAASSSFDLRTYWTTLISQIEEALDAAVPVRYPESIHKAIRHVVLSPGAKRAPPIMCIASCELVGGLRSAAFPAACALEMVHAASLVHDDLPCMDSSPLRRGQPSAHALFGVDMAILAGDALFPLAYQHIVTHTPSPDPVPLSVIPLVLTEIARAVGSTGMAAGQFLDLSGAAAGSEKEILQVLEKKFGEMAECSAVCGGLLGGASDQELEALRRYGRAVGVLYQLVDDVLMESNGGTGKMRSNASIVKAVGMDRSLELVEEVRANAKKELDKFKDKYGEKVLPLYSFVDYAIERGFVVEGRGLEASSAAGGSDGSSETFSKGD
ncbi:heterodimeric geranylgeranyl pyrophosphate synthase small subunit, chloroplastic-like [Zingiber officinale]|nr:heterodimeric geranylgeranyl pyrophosphate synthase small subunit, chloroplastic-like [Zingiber officinale]XP_042382446.1 heterodimeric geranylgeranyl pyrophosphate synthase small subunit, chloroplastic-like [Zingiber officinale]